MEMQTGRVSLPEGGDPAMMPEDGLLGKLSCIPPEDDSRDTHTG